MLRIRTKWNSPSGASPPPLVPPDRTVRLSSADGSTADYIYSRPDETFPAWDFPEWQSKCEFQDEVSAARRQHYDKLRNRLHDELQQLADSLNYQITQFKATVDRERADLIAELKSWKEGTKDGFRLPFWEPFRYISRTELPPTTLPQAVLDAAFHAARRAKQLTAHATWERYFSQAALQTGYREMKTFEELDREFEDFNKKFGGLIEPSPFRVSPKRKLLRKTVDLAKQLFNQRVALESAEGYKGQRFVTVDPTAVRDLIEGAAQAEDELRMWLVGQNTNATMTLEDNRRNRREFRERRRQRVQEIISLLRAISASRNAGLTDYYDAFRQQRWMLLQAYQEELNQLKMNLDTSDYHWMYRDEVGFSVPTTRVYGSYALPQSCVLEAEDPSSWGTPKFATRPAKEGNLVLQLAKVNGDVPGIDARSNTSPKTFTSLTLNEGADWIGQLFRSLTKGDWFHGQNIIGELAELRDLPRTVKDIGKFLKWGKAVRQTGLRTAGLSLRGLADAYLEYSYGVAPTVSTVKGFLGNFSSVGQWFSFLLDPKRFDPLKGASTVAVTQTKTFSGGDPATGAEKTSGYVDLLVRQWFRMRSEDRLGHNRRPVMGNFVIGDELRLVGDRYVPVSTIGTSADLILRWLAGEYPLLSSESEMSSDGFSVGRYSPVATMSDHQPFLPVSFRREVTKLNYRLFAKAVADWKVEDVGKRTLLFTQLIAENSLGETLWNWIPFSFMVDWFFGFKEVFKNLDGLFFSAYQGAKLFHQPWLRTTELHTFITEAPTLTLGQPTLVGWGLEDGDLDNSNLYARTVQGSSPWIAEQLADGTFEFYQRGHLRIRIPLSVVWSAQRYSWRKTVNRDELPEDTINYLYAAFSGDVGRSFKFKFARRRARAVSTQVAALGTGGFGVKLELKRAKRCISRVAKVENDLAAGRRGYREFQALLGRLGGKTQVSPTYYRELARACGLR